MIVFSEIEEKPINSVLPNNSVGECNGTFGELIQGVLTNDKHFLVTLPINIKSVVEYETTETGKVDSNLQYKSKSIQAVRNYLQLHGLPPGGFLRFKSTFSAGKGFASSSADMVAAIRAVSKCFNRTASPELIELILRDIEPTDGVMYGGIVSYYHREVRLEEKIAETPRLVIVSADRGGEYNTIEFNKKKHDVSLATKFEYKEMLASIKLAIRDGDLGSLGRLSSRSCELSQAFNPNPYYTLMSRLCVETDALGLVATHSGTCLGLLYNLGDSDQVNKTEHALKHLISSNVDCNKYLSI